MKIKCHQCGIEVEKFTGHVNRALKMGNNVYCGRKCEGIGRQKGYTNEDRKKIKHDYDQKRKGLDWMPLYNAFCFHLDYAANPEKYREIRRKKYPKHLLYLKSSKYRNYKKQYDHVYHAKNKYGAFWEAAILVENIEQLIDKDQSRQDRDCHNKQKKRKKLCKS